MSPTMQGLLLGLLSQVLFGTLYLFSHWMQPLTGTDVFAVRSVVMLGGIVLIMTMGRQLGQFPLLVRTILGKSGKRWAIMLMGTAIVGSQFWLFMWAPVNQQGLNVAMGYFLFPLAMVLMGRLWFKERLKPLQLTAVCLAMLGVGYELWQTLAISWVTLWVVLVYPPYYLSRRVLNIPALAGLCFDLLILAPLSLLYLFTRPEIWQLVANEPRFSLLLPGLGICSAMAMFANLKASSLLQMNIFGMLSYLEPALLFVIAVWVLDEPVSASAPVTYSLIWAALGLLALHGFLNRPKRINAFVPPHHGLK